MAVAGKSAELKKAETTVWEKGRRTCKRERHMLKDKDETGELKEG